MATHKPAALEGLKNSSQAYNYPYNGDASDVGSQMKDFHHHKRSIIEARRKMVFSSMGSGVNLPMHSGKTVKVNVYLPMLHPDNKHNHGLNADGIWYADGNMYARSRLPGDISSGMPTLGEDGGRRNRVALTRKEREGSINKFGIFTEYTQDMINFDSDSELMMHISRELITAAVEIYEDVLMKDLLASAGTYLYPGSATTIATMDPTPTDVRLKGLANTTHLTQMSKLLDKLKCPRDTKMITGHNFTDTKTIPHARYLFVGPEIEDYFRSLTAYHGVPAFKPVESYGAAAASSVREDEIGTISNFRVIQVQDFLNYAGLGADSTGDTNDEFMSTNDKFDVFPMMVLGDESFATIDFRNSKKAKKHKFDIKHKKPGLPTADDPFGERGFKSLKYFYGLLILRPERIAIVYTCLPNTLV
jgi:N4-gp56 family major capsid protein